MRNLNDPRQTALFDLFEEILSPVAYRKLKNGWQHLFRCAILKLMPVGKLAEHFHPEIGRPTKELYSMAARAKKGVRNEWHCRNQVGAQTGL